MKNRNLLLSIDAAVTRVTKWLTLVAAVCAGFMMVIAVVDVIGAKFFKWAIPSAGGFIEELMVLIVFLSIAYVEQERGHIRITILEERFTSAGKNVFRLVGYVIAIIVIGFLAWRAFLLEEYTIAIMLLKQGTIRIPLWPSASAVFLGWACLTITYILRFGKAIIAESKG